MELMSKPSLLTAALAAAFTLSFGSPAWATTVVNDTFDVGAATTADDPTDPLDASWTAVRGSVSVVDDSGGLGSGNALFQGNAGGFTFLHAFGNFGAVSVGVGETIELSFDMRIDSLEGDNSGGFRFGLGDDASGETYVGRFGVGTSTGISLQFNPNDELGGGGTTTLTDPGSTPLAITGTGEHQVSLLISRVSATQTDLALSFDGSVVGTATASGSSLINSFDVIRLGSGNLQTQWRYDNITVETGLVPEPASLALLGLGGVYLLGRRRRG